MSAAIAEELQEGELRLLESLRSQYEAQGYSFIIHPDKADLPSFLASYRPDAIARRANRNVAIEVKSRSRLSDQLPLERIRRLFDGHPNWRFTVAYSGSDAGRDAGFPVSDRNSVLGRLSEVRELEAKGHPAAAFVMAWSLLEAALNSALPKVDKRARMPGTVVQTLAMNGLISLETEQRLRQLVQLRNEIVHGGMPTQPTKDDIELVLSAVTSALG